MTQEDKELLLKDLSARLPYGVKVKVSYDYDTDEEITGDFILNEIDTRCKQNYYWIGGDQLQVAGIKGGVSSFATSSDDEDEVVKPYLFPLSSMTEEQKNQLKEIWDADMNKALDYAISGEEGLSDLFQLSAAKKVIDWFIKNHFDYQGLIPKELAIDCTNLNIY